MKTVLKVLAWIATAVLLAWIAELIGGQGAGGTVLLIIGAMLGAYYGVEMSRNYSARVEQARQDLISGRNPGESAPGTTSSEDSSDAKAEKDKDHDA